MEVAQQHGMRTLMAGKDMNDLIRRWLCSPLRNSPERFQRHVLSFVRHTGLNVKSRITDLVIFYERCKKNTSHGSGIVVRSSDDAGSMVKLLAWPGTREIFPVLSVSTSA